VYDMICLADTVGVFQVESRAQAQVLPRLKPRCFADLIVTISLIRPGPVQGDMVHPYLRRRLGQEPVSYLHPLLEDALQETLGVILFQEQVLKVARDLAGFTAGQGELLRRALSAKNSGEAVDKFREAFLAGAMLKGVDLETAELVFEKLRAFGGYSFPKSHAASFAVLVYHSAWLKYYYPAAFFVALLSNQPMGFWSPAVLINDARRHDISVLGVDIQRSQAECSLEKGGIRLGFDYVHGLGEAGARIVAAREEGEFRDLREFCRRVPLPRRLVENLVAAGAMDGWGQHRRTLFWELGLLPERRDTFELTFPAEEIALPALTDQEAVSYEYAMTGLSTGPHPLLAHRAQLAWRGILSSADLSFCTSGETVLTAGLLVVHQSPPTAKGFHFLTLEDEHGFINVIVRPAVYAKYRKVVRQSPLLLVQGEVQQESEVTNVLTVRISVL
jgi:error-prone DNA polymerase